MSTPSTKSATSPQPAVDLEVKDAQLIFNSVWKDLEIEYGRSRLHFPKELILLGGAPGAGKGTNTEFICKVRDISAGPIVVSELLNSPEAKAIKAKGGMVGDREVGWHPVSKVVGTTAPKRRDPGWFSAHQGSG